MSCRRGLFRRRCVLAAAGRRSHRTDGARGLPETGAGGRDARARRAERFRGNAALAAVLRSNWRRLGTRARVAEDAARALTRRHTAAAFAFFAGVALMATYPLLRHPTRTIAGGLGDPMILDRKSVV